MLTEFSILETLQNMILYSFGVVYFNGAPLPKFNVNHYINIISCQVKVDNGWWKQKGTYLW